MTKNENALREKGGESRRGHDLSPASSQRSNTRRKTDKGKKEKADSCRQLDWDGNTSLQKKGSILGEEVRSQSRKERSPQPTGYAPLIIKFPKKKAEDTQEREGPYYERFPRNREFEG